MGRGTAFEAKLRYPGIDIILAEKIIANGNVVNFLLEDPNDGKWIISFPTKNHWRDNSDIGLIEQSAIQLKKIFDMSGKSPIVAIPRPGCSNGRLQWIEVKKVIEPILSNDNFVIVCNK